MDNQTRLKQKGYAVIRGLLTPEEAQTYRTILEEKSAIREKKGGQLGQTGLTNSWSQPDGVTQNPAFWPLITNPRLLEAVRSLLGTDDIRYLQHNDLHVGFSAISWHRDNVNRNFNIGPDWQGVDEEPYRIVRVGIYLQTYVESKFKLGFIPGSHQPKDETTILRKFNEAKLKMLGAMNYLSSTVQMRAANADWVATDPGDCIIFDPRTIHSGSYITGPKYSIFVAYGVENEHFYHHWNYYRNVRTELGYSPMPEELKALLAEHDLLPAGEPTADSVPDAWVPPTLIRNQLASRLKM